MPEKGSEPHDVVRAKAAARVAKGKRKRPVHYTERTARTICERLARGERWRDMADGKGMPGYSVIYNWLRRHPEFEEAYCWAKRAGADARADQALEVAEKATKETVAVDRLHIGTLKWHVERDTKIYGPKPDEPDLGAGRKLIIEVRRFERFIDADGTPRVRELLPAPKAGDGR